MQSLQSDTLFLHILGTGTIVLYYGIVVYVGMWATQSEDEDDASPPDQQLKCGTQEGQESTEPCKQYLLRLFLANRGLPLSIGFISMTATWVGAGYINGTAEAVFNDGLIWCQAPLGYALSLVVGGLFFAGRMRSTRALTMLDPFQQYYGPWIAVLLCVPALCGEVFWTASNLSALGDTVSTIAYLNKTFIIVASTLVIVFYASVGGLASVMHTDVVQLCFALLGLWCCVPFIVANRTAAKISDAKKDWLGVIENRDVGQIFDQLLMTIFGGVPWQVYFQRVLSSDSAFSAKMLSYLSAPGCMFLALPPIIVGAATKSANFTANGYPGPYNLEPDQRRYVMPHAVRYLTPNLVSIMGQLAIMASVMSSVDSSMLSASSLITRNVYQQVLKPMASQEEMCRVLRVSIWSISLLAMIMALNVQSVFALWTLSSDLVYVLLFPQFVALFFLRDWSNAYGAVFGFFVGFVVRALCGEPKMGVPVIWRLPNYDSERGQHFPFRTMCMLISLCAHFVGSVIATCVFQSGLLAPHYDVWGCFCEISATSVFVPVADSARSSSGGTNAVAADSKVQTLQEARRGVASSSPGTITTLPCNFEGGLTPETSNRPTTAYKEPRARKASMAADANFEYSDDPINMPTDKADDMLKTERIISRFQRVVPKMPMNFERNTDRPATRRQSVASKSSGGSKTRRTSGGSEARTRTFRDIDQNTDKLINRRQSVVSKSGVGSNSRRTSELGGESKASAPGNVEPSTDKYMNRRQSVMSKSGTGLMTKQIGMTGAKPKSARPRKAESKGGRLSVLSKKSDIGPTIKKTRAHDTELKDNPLDSIHLPAGFETETQSSVSGITGPVGAADTEISKINRRRSRHPSATEPDAKVGQLLTVPDIASKTGPLKTKRMGQPVGATKKKEDKGNPALKKDGKTKRKE